MIKNESTDYRWHEYYEVSFQFRDDETIHVFPVTDDGYAIWAYFSAMNTANIEWAAVHHVWYGRKCREIDSTWQYDPIVWFGLD